MTNGEKYRGAKERAEAFKEYCKDTSNGLCWQKGEHACSRCAFHWLDLEAEEEEPLPCPFCGGKMLVGENAYTHRRLCVCEKRCGYISQYGDSEHQAIAAHNRVARAVAKVEEANDANA